MTSSQTSDTELKPCPFCGGPAELRPYGNHGAKVQCRRCSAMIGGKVFKSFGIEQIKDSVVNRWNGRISNHVSK